MKHPLLSRLALAGLLALPAASALAADGDGTGGVEILQSLTVNETTALDFGQINRPSAGTNTFTLAATGSTVTTAGAGDGFYAGSAASGVFAVTGQPNQAIQASVAITDFTDEGLTVGAAFINGVTDSVSSTLDAEGAFTANIGGELTVASTAALGPHSTTVTVTVVYE